MLKVETPETQNMISLLHSQQSLLKQERQNQQQEKSCFIRDNKVFFNKLFKAKNYE
jgi:hypothetical protein